MERYKVVTRYFGDFDVTGLVLAVRDDDVLVEWDDDGSVSWLKNWYLARTS